MNAEERALLQAIDAILQSDDVRAQIAPLVERAARKLAQEPAAVLSWEPIPLSVYAGRLPAAIRSSWVFILRGGTTTGAERHSNSHQRMMSYEGEGDFQTGGEGRWKSNFLVSERDAGLEERWISIPPGVWHQGVVPDGDWVVVSFHTVPAEELVEERPGTRRRRYLAA